MVKKSDVEDVSSFIKGLEGSNISVDWIVYNSSIPRLYEECVISKLRENAYLIEDGILGDNSVSSIDINDFDTYKIIGDSCVLKRGEEILVQVYKA